MEQILLPQTIAFLPTPATQNQTMHRNILTILICFIMGEAFGQEQQKIATYLQTQYNKTLYDKTIGNNPWSIGLGLQAFFPNASPFRFTVDLTADAYLEDDKVLRLNPDDTPVDDLRGMINLFAGAAHNLTPHIYLSLVAGSSLVGGRVLTGIKPSAGFYFAPNKRFTGKVSYINIFNRDKNTKEDFGSISISFSIRLF
jgi:hypothetical protein